MRNGRFLGLLAAGIAISAWMAPATALGAHHCDSLVKSTTYLMELQGSHGYRIEIESFPTGKVVLSAENGNFFAVYAVDGESSERGLKADFGGLGRIAVHFHRPGHEVFEAEPVKLKGTIEFHGEEGFTSLSRKHARGVVVHRFRRVCSGGRSRVPVGASRLAAFERQGRAAGGRAVATTLVAAEHTPSRAVVVALAGSQPPDPQEEGEEFAVAFLEERRDGMYIARAGILDPLAGTVIPSPPGVEPLSGSVALGYPFSGTAAFSRASNAPTSWSGDLTASLPGAANVPLTGPGFSAVACSGVAETSRLEACEEEAEELEKASFLRPSLLF
jgi:hypothetical protein